MGNLLNHWSLENVATQRTWRRRFDVMITLLLRRVSAGNKFLIHICWFNFDALAQGNAHKPTKEPIDDRGPGGDRTHYL